ncbi:IBR domain-containing protein [Colletotrichum sojae]|uniref:IBR domain-containing protein n=1 Tax=Colletotrichum sojae TaxID=2175907 RepID=A0A8H6JX65_9PEZI|nr:IBR domain-containing protein [Colletotrichum sojae]
MEQFQLLDEDVANLILRHGFLDVEDLPFATAEEVENAATLALQMADPEEQLAIAMRRSTIAGRHQPETATAGPAVRRARPARPDPREIEEGEPDSEAYVDWQERNRILTDTPEGVNDEEDEDGPDCIVCSGGSQPKRQLPCGCWFCTRCLRSCIRAGLRPGGWPPHCCQPLERDTITWVRRPGLSRLYRQVREENETPAEQRVYCPRPQCAVFIPSTGPHVHRDLMRCRACGEGACRRCRAPIHPGRPCRPEQEDEMLMDIMDQNNLSSCPFCRRVVELWDGCNHITCVCGQEWCFLCGSPYGNNGCESGCPQYGRDGRIPMRQRGVRFRQRQDFPTAVTLPAGLPPPVPPGVPEPRHVFAPPQPPPPPPVEEPGPLNHPDQGQMLQSESRRLAWRKPPTGNQFSIILFYPDGQNTEVENPQWRRDSRVNIQRIRDDVEDEGRVWPEYAIEREDPGCRHQMHQQWRWQANPEPPCFYCRIRDGRQLWRCQNCGVTACDQHRFTRFGLSRDQANFFVERLRSRVTVESDFRYPRANVALIDRWDLFLRPYRRGRLRLLFGIGGADGKLMGIPRSFGSVFWIALRVWR